MNRVSASLGSILFLIIAPGTIAGLVPWWISKWTKASAFPNNTLLDIVALVVIAGGLVLLLDSFVRFALQGVGTPAPVFPTRHLVVTGLYRYVRNPIYLAVTALVLGQGLLFANTILLLYGTALWIGFHLFVVFYEEPKLRATFAGEYEVYCTNVPRWLPRSRPWQPET
jgi:protein-S-isoprenylcysteine O-methyltransferase Ste14